MMIVVNIGAEEEHAAVIFTDLGKAQYFGKELSRAFEISYFENQMADSSDFE